MPRKLTVIVPAYRAESFIAQNLQIFREAFTKFVPEVIDNFEIICVVDGTALDATFDEASKVDGIRVVGYEENKGKGYALRHGFTYATGDIVTFIDADGDFNPEQLRFFFPYLATADLVVGSKRHPFSKVKYPFVRRVMSRSFQLLSWLILGINIRDTQSGLKLIKKEVLDVIMPLLRVERFAFDLELCFLAQKHGFRTVEAPICINFQNQSTIVSPRVPFHMFFDMLRIRYRYSFRKYYQRKFHESKFNF